MPLGEKADDSDIQEIQTVEVISNKERDQEQEVTVQPQVEENTVNTAVVEEKNSGLDWDEALAVEKLLEESGLEYRICEDELLDLPKDIADHLRDVQYVQDCLSEEILVVFERLRAHGLRLHPGKCKFFQEKVEYLGNVIYLGGLGVQPGEVLIDQGTEFQGEFQVLCDKALIDHRTTSRDYPEADGLVERVVQTVKRALRKYGLHKGHLGD
ncbi:hypothetical protein AXG93_1502s1410 [Marchantia polymorpha subsp. ruderalis]|uniref:Integrase catalytic domain-containing protein n=1 Tax=Marchantia polymorpha subsp. ruderalis TaxID=1480154 RepID=A0A176WD92_MARPO|nr:hypothetical protein AXG93_1502s1410 [Marchantia polymorpha subsp. ruderalis]